jgi:hypothetical protein
MNNKKAILGISFAAAFAVSLIFAQSAIAMSENALPGYRDIVGNQSSTANVGGDEFFKATINTEDPIVHNGQKGAYGFGIFTEGTTAALALTTHMCVSDTLVQGNAPDARCPDTIGLLDLLTGTPGVDAVHDDSTFHAHMLVLTFDTTGCNDPNSFAQVNVTATLEYQDDGPGAIPPYLSPDWPVKVTGKSITVGNVPVEAFDGTSNVVDVVSYGITPEDNGSGTVTNLCLTNPP